jgi:hypothetical protein
MAPIPKFLSFLAMICLLPWDGISQPLRVFKTDEQINIDGILDENVWQSAALADNFVQYFPSDTSAAIHQTEVRITYEDQYIYIAAKMYRNGSQKYVTPSLRRDFRGPTNDVLAVTFDTYKDRTNAFSFGINPFGVQREGLVAGGGNRTGGGLATKTKLSNVV